MTQIAFSLTVEMLFNQLTRRAEAAICEPGGLFSSKYVTTCEDNVPENRSAIEYLQMNDWQAYYFMQTYEKFGKQRLASGIVENFLLFQEESGRVPQTVYAYKQPDKGIRHCKPFLCQMAVRAVDPGVLSKQWCGLKKYLTYYLENRKDTSGLFYWSSTAESGIFSNADFVPLDTLFITDMHQAATTGETRIAAVDLNSLLVREFQRFADCCVRLGKITEAEHYLGLAAELQYKIEELLWDPEQRMYYNMQCDTAELVPVDSWTGAFPALLGICTPERRKAVMQNLLNPQKFFRPAGIASVSAEDPLYNQAHKSVHGRMIVPNCWGPVWMLPNVLVFRALQEQGYCAHAAELASRVVATIRNDFFETGTIHDSYDADTLAPLSDVSTMAWKTMALELIDYVRHNIWPQTSLFCP